MITLYPNDKSQYFLISLDSSLKSYIYSRLHCIFNLPTFTTLIPGEQASLTVPQEEQEASLTCCL